MRSNGSYPVGSFYSIIADVENYSKFLPFCEESIITARDDNGIPTRAVLKIGWEAFNESYESDLTFEEGQTVIAQAHDSSTFKTLYSKWQLKEIKMKNHNQAQTTPSSKCAVDFDLKFEFNNPLYNKILSGFGETLAKHMMKAFEKRAQELSSS